VCGRIGVRRAIATTLQAIHRDPAHPWRVGSLAAHAGLSRAAFANVFKREYGTAPGRYRHRTGQAITDTKDDPPPDHSADHLPLPRYKRLTPVGTLVIRPL
jgi:AraC-like DNA-binding protein